MFGFDSKETVVLVNLILAASGVILTGITVYYIKNVHSWVKRLTAVLASIGPVFLVTVAAVALMKPSPTQTGLNDLTASIQGLVQDVSNFVTAFERFVDYFVEQDNREGNSDLDTGKPAAPAPNQPPGVAVVPPSMTPTPLAQDVPAKVQTQPPPTVDLGPGPQRYPKGTSPWDVPSETRRKEVSPSSVSTPPASSSAVGNLVTCAPPNPPHNAWIWLYRLDGNEHWQRISKGIGAIDPSGRLKIDGLPVDVDRFGTRGEPYRIELVIDGRVVESTGNFQAGEPEFRLFPDRNNATSWPCPYPVQ